MGKIATPRKSEVFGTPAKTELNTPKSLKKKKIGISTPQLNKVTKTPKSEKKNKELSTPKVDKVTKTPKSENKKKELSTPKVDKSEKSPKLEKKNTDMEQSPQSDVKYKKVLAVIPPPFIRCCKSFLLQICDTDKPVIFQEPLSLFLRYADRQSAVDAVKLLKNMSNNKNLKVEATLKDVRQTIKNKRIIFVPSKAPLEEAISVLKKTYGATDVEQGDDRFVSVAKMILTFSSEERALAADKIERKLYHGLELMLSTLFSVGKRTRDEGQNQNQNATKKAKTEESVDDDSDEESDNDDSDEKSVDDSDEESDEKEQETTAAEVDDDDDDDEDQDDDEEEEDDDDEEEESEE